MIGKPKIVDPDTSETSSYESDELMEDQVVKKQKKPPMCDEDGDELSNVTIEQLNENIKVNIRSSEESDIELIKRLNVDDELEMHALLKLHVNRWKMAKQEWFNYYSIQSKPYENSYQKLKAIFEDIG